jgi:hypothetical protein
MKIKKLCLPKGLVFQKHYTKPKFHPYIITREDGSRIYGAALIFFELIEEDAICSAMQSLQTMYDAEFSHSKTNTSANSSTLLNRSNNNSTNAATLNHATQLANTQQQQQHHHSYHSARNKSNTATPITTKPQSGVGGGRHHQSTSESALPGSSINESVHFSIGPSESSSISEENMATAELSAELKAPPSANASAFVFNNNRTVNFANKSNIMSPYSSSSSSLVHHKQNSLSNNNTNVLGTPPTPPPPLSLSSTTNSGRTTSHYSMFKDRLYASKCICLVSQYPFNKAFQRILRTLYDMVERTDLLGISLESHLYNLLYEIPAPRPGQLVEFYVGCKPTYAYMPDYSSNGVELPLFDYDLFEFFRIFGVNNMINLYMTALLEHQILLHSKDYYSLMLVAESLTCLFFPFVWSKPYVPIVPASNLHFIEAPVPYIMGFHHRDIDKEFFKQGQRCFVDIDSGTVTCPEGLPDFPDKNKFIKEINEIIVYFTGKLNELKATTAQSGRTTIALESKSSQVENLSVKKYANETDAASSIENGGVFVADVDVNGTESSNESHNKNGGESAATTSDILLNSQAFARIAELARKAGAINDDYLLDRSNGRVRSSSRRNCSADFATNTVTCGGADEASKLRNGSSPPLPPSLKIDQEELISMQFSQCIRELFLLKFVQMFASYEKFVIVPNIENNKIETWWTNREYSGNFDSKMFLIDQPSPRLPFLSHFIATQMFVSFVDLKIVSSLQNEKEPSVKVCYPL